MFPVVTAVAFGRTYCPCVPAGAPCIYYYYTFLICCYYDAGVTVVVAAVAVFVGYKGRASRNRGKLIN